MHQFSYSIIQVLNNHQQALPIGLYGVQAHVIVVALAVILSCSGSNLYYFIDIRDFIHVQLSFHILTQICFEHVVTTIIFSQNIVAIFVS